MCILAILAQLILLLASWGTIHKYRTYLEKIFEPQIGMEKKNNV